MNTHGRWTLTIAAVALLTASWSAPSHALAQGMAPARPARPAEASGLMLGVPLSALNLNPDQQGQIRTILASYRTSMRPIVQQLQQAQAGLSDKLLAPGQPQAADLQPQLAQISQLRGQLLQLSAQATLDIRNVLSPAQLATASQTKAKLRELRSQMNQILTPDQPN